MNNNPHDHNQELGDNDFSECCKNCQHSVEIIKPHLMNFYHCIKSYTIDMLLSMKDEEIYELYQVLDDIVHLDPGDRLADLILNDIEIHQTLPTIRSYYATFFSVHEYHLAQRLLQTDHPEALLKSFPLYQRYVRLVTTHVERMGLSSGSRMAFIGCGPVPMTQILLSILYGISSIGFDTDNNVVKLANRCIAHLGESEHITIVHGNETQLWEKEWNAILVAGLAEPKQRIFETLRKVFSQRGPVPLAYRTYTGLRAVLYYPVQPEDIVGFKVIDQINPTGRVNNTLVFLELS